MTVDDLADWAGMQHKTVAAGMEALVAAGPLDIDLERFDRAAWFVPSWSTRQFESDDITVRTTKHRSKERSNVVPGNTPEQNRAEQTPLDVPVEATPYVVERIDTALRNQAIENIHDIRTKRAERGG